MFFQRQNRSHRNRNAKARRLRMESLEDRRLLTMADIVFMVDESASEESTHDWLKAMITGDAASSIPSFAEGRGHSTFHEGMPRHSTS